MKILLWITTGSVLAVALIAAWLGFNFTRNARSELAGLATQRAKLDAEIGSAQERFTGASHDEAELRTALKNVQAQVENPTAAVAQKPAAAPQPTPPARPDLAALMEANPELRTLFKRSFQANLGLRYLPLYHAAGLSPAQIQKFEELMTDAEQDKMDLQAAAKTQGLAAADPAIAKMRQQMEAKLQAAQTEVLGEAGYQQLLQYKRTEPVIGFVSDTAGLIAHTAGPLTAAQGEQLVNLLANASSRFQTGGTADLQTVDWPRALAQAQTFLAPEQLAALKANSQNLQVLTLMKQFYQQKAAAGK